MLEAGPRGAKPRRLLTSRNIILYGFLFVTAVYWLLPLYVMVVTSLKGMPEIRLGNVFSPPMEITFAPWAKAWDSACTGLYCCLLYTSPSPRDRTRSRMPSSA